jgi:hypothetical protein
MANSKISALTSATTPLVGTETLPIVQGGVTVKATVANITGAGAYPGSFTTLASTGTLTRTATAATNSLISDATGSTTGYSYSRIRNTSGNAYFGVEGSAAGTLSASTLAYSAIFGSATNQATQIITNNTVRVTISAVGGVSIGSTTNAGVGNLLMGTGNVVQGTAAKGFDFSANTPAAGKTSTLLNWYEEGTWTPNQGAGLTLVGAFSSTGRYTRIGRQISISGTVTGATSVAVTAAGVVTSNLPFTVVTAGHGGATNVANNAFATVICTGTSVTSAAAIAATATITFSATYFV